MTLCVLNRFTYNNDTKENINYKYFTLFFLNIMI
ncbi:hypothetical protein ATK78_4437 [Pedobacter metabolipauper]|uniref:Uncharacterized protein n=1 Tax=Pedobacter metabolipauper TaxID=425513 RepID=A0A4R6SRR2_9SPHI|nr:hypothetical protein ATK78_4437 [Pedobacter metabolipauper]